MFEFRRELWLSAEDLELAILDLFKTHDNISEIYEFACENGDDLTANMLLGTIEFMNVRMNNLMRTFDEMESNGLID